MKKPTCTFSYGGLLLCDFEFIFFFFFCLKCELRCSATDLIQGCLFKSSFEMRFLFKIVFPLKPTLHIFIF